MPLHTVMATVSGYIVGLGHHYPPYTNSIEDNEGYLAKFCDMGTPA